MASNTDNLQLAAALTSAWLGNAHIRPAADDVPAFLRSMHEALAKLGGSASLSVDEPASGEQQFTPAVSVRKSLASSDHIISMIDGQPYKSLRRHLSANGLDPDSYRQRYGLKKDYPMVAPGYSAARSETAKRLGLGRKPGQKAKAAVVPSPTDGADQPKRRGRKSISEAKAAPQAHLNGKGR